MLKKILVLSLLMVAAAMSGCGGANTAELLDEPNVTIVAMGGGTSGDEVKPDTPSWIATLCHPDLLCMSMAGEPDCTGAISIKCQEWSKVCTNDGKPCMPYLGNDS